MAKFFFKKGKRRHKPLRSQLVGIAWITALLLLLLGYYFFSLHRASGSTLTDSIETAATEILTKKEDSVYKSRRQGGVTYRKPARYIPRDTLLPTLYTQQAPPKRKQPLTVELNRADTTALQLLHGIGPAYARRIVAYRDRLGGFVADSQLLEVYGFTPELLAHLRPYLRIDTADRRRLAINSASLKELSRHPYLEYYQARDIVNLRARGQRFHKEADLRAIPSMADSSLERLRPYLDYTLPEAQQISPIAQ